MKTLFYLLALSLLASGCGSLKTKSQETVATSFPRDKKISPRSEYNIFFELVSEQKVQLQFKNLDKGDNLSLIIEKGISQRPIPAGHWELTGFERDGISFLSMNTSKKFVLTVKPKSNIYGGSLVLGCPSIGPDDFKLLMAMKFFNRYPFSSSIGLCELVVGDDFSGVKANLKKSQDFKKLNLSMGF